MPESTPTAVAVLGSYRGGTSAVTEVLKNLGCYVGDSFVNAWSGYWTYEDVYLRRLCFECFDEREGVWSYVCDADARVKLLARWADWARWRASASRSGIITGKHPTMCKFVPELLRAWSNSTRATRLISVVRDVDEILAAWRRSTLSNGGPWWPRGDIQRIVPDLIQSRDSSLVNVEHLVVEFEKLRRDPFIEIKRIADYCGASKSGVVEATGRFVST